MAAARDPLTFIESPVPAGARPVRGGPAPSRRIELASAGLAWLSAALTLASVLGAVAPRLVNAALGLALAGLLAGCLAAVASLRVATLRHLLARTTGGHAYDQLRGLRTLRVTSVLLQLLASFAWVGVLGRLLQRAGVLEVELESALVERSVLVLLAALGASQALAHLQSLRTPTTRDDSAPARVTLGIALGIALGAAALGALCLAGADPALGPVSLERDDTALLAVFGFAALAAALRRSRGLPTLMSLLADEPTGARGTAPVNRTKTVLVPAILAFALLLVVFLLVLLFGIGIGDLITTVENSPVLLVSVLFLVVALAGSLLVAVTLSRSAERDAPLYAKLPDRKARQARLLMIGSAVAVLVFAVLTAMAFFGPLHHSAALHFVCLGLLAAVGPYGFYIAREHNRVRRLEERFPDFLRDIASSHKGGLTLNQSVTIAARGEYGPLTPEVRKMADQLSWNVSFHEALERFAARVETPLVQRAVNLILEADRSGGSTTDVLLAAARDAREIKNLENERRTTMGLYTVVVYITFFVFLGVAATLYGQFAPAIVESANAAAEAGTLASGTAAATKPLDLADYQLFYFVAAVVQAVGDGMVAGLLGSGRSSLGLRHAFLMVLATYITFILLL